MTDREHLADELVQTAESLANRWDSDGPQALAELAERLHPGNGWTLLAIARETLRTLVIADPLDDPATSVALGWVTAALRVRGAMDADARPVNNPSRWATSRAKDVEELDSRVLDDEDLVDDKEWEPS